MGDTNHRVFASLDELFSKTKTFDRENYTHSIRAPFEGKLCVGFDTYKSFWTLYCNAVERGDALCVSETVSTQEIPIIVDIDFYYKDDDLVRKYTQKDLKNIVAIYQDVIRETLVVENERELMCVVMEKPETALKHGKPYDGIHLMFPDCITDIDIQTTVIRPKVVERIKESGIFRKLELASDDLEEIIDHNVPRRGLTWVMYGARRDPQAQTYNYTMIIDSRLNTCALNDILARDDFDKWHEIIDEPFFQEKPLQYYVPMWLSIHGRQGLMKRRAETQEHVDGIIMKKIIKKKREQERAQSYEPVDLNQQLQDAEKLLEMLSPTHRDSYDTWVRTGIVLHRISNGREAGLQLWRNWSSTSPKYEDGCCEKNWGYFDDSNCWSIATLHYWARQQNYLKYKAWNETKITFYVNQAECGSHYDLAMLLKKLFHGKYVCANLDKGIWYEFREHRWHIIQKGYKLNDMISTELVKIINKKRAEYVLRTDGTDDSVEKKLKDLGRIIQNLKQSPFKRCIMEECKSLFYNEDFFELLDENKDLMCFKNGVLDMSRAPWIFRDGTPDDYLGRSTKINFPTWLKSDSDEVIETHKMIEKIFVNPRIRKFALKTFASIFKGGNIYKTFPIMHGSGDNGKSIIQEIMMKILGESYGAVLNISIATGKRTQSSGATSDLEFIRGKRAVFLQEPSKDESFNLGVIKQMTGNDAIYSRGNYKDGGMFQPQCKVIMSANDLPEVKNAQDQAFFNRTGIIRCESTFCSKMHARYNEVPIDEAEQFEKKLFFADVDIRTKYDDIYVPGLLWILAQELNDVMIHGIEKPREVLEATEFYQRSNDSFRQFYNETFKQTDDEEDEITLPQAFMLFKTWHQEACPGSKIPSRNDLQSNMEKVYGHIAKNKWVKLTTLDGDDDA